MPRCCESGPLGVPNLHHFMLLQNRIENSNEDGDIVEDWETEDTVWAAIDPLRGREFWNAAQVQSDVTHRVTIRYLENVHSGQRLVKDDDQRAFNITAVINPGERNARLELMCKEAT